jgi:hypothetical protein
MDHLVAPLELLFINPDPDGPTRNIVTIGIGDGGNEVGMGKVYDRIVNSTVPNASTIACTISADHLLVCAVSNWGGYALAAALAVVHHSLSPTHAAHSIQTADGPDEQADGNDVHTTPQSVVASLDILSTEDEQRRACVQLVAAGARDGITKENALFIDGMTLEVSLGVLTAVNDIAKEYIIESSVRRPSEVL